MSDLHFTPIGVVRSPFREKFGIPRQPGLATHAMARLVLTPECGRAACVEGLEGFSHLWVVFAFHGTANQGWRPTVRPPRLGGNKRLGVFATRSTFRPNPIGLSVVELVGIVDGPAGKELLLRGTDLLDGTPVLDIKPYIPYADAVPDARSGFAPDAPMLLPVQWTPQAEEEAAGQGVDADLRALIEEVLAQDPRPAYAATHHDPEREYGVRLAHVNVRFRIAQDGVTITSLQP